MAETIELGIVGIKNCGDYDSETTYEKLNVVTYQGSSYCALKTTLGNPPTNTDFWQLYAAKGETGDTGPKGDPGNPGATGPKGDPGGSTPLAATSVTGMTDTTKVYVNTSDGNWYYYDGDSWEIGGAYQSSVDDVGLDIIEITSDIRPFLTRSDYVSKNLHATTGELVDPTTPNTRISTENIQYTGNKILKLIPRVGYLYRVALYNRSGNNYVFQISYSNIDHAMYIPENKYFRVCIYKSADASANVPISLDEYDNLLYESDDCKQYVDIYDGNLAKDMPLFTTGHYNGFPSYQNNQTRVMTPFYYKYPYAITLYNNTDNMGMNVFLYNESLTTKTRELTGWNGAAVTPSIEIPANTWFKLYLRKLDDSNFDVEWWGASEINGDDFNLSINLVESITENIFLKEEYMSNFRYKPPYFANVCGISNINNKRLTLIKLNNNTIDPTVGFQSVCYNNIDHEIYTFSDNRTSFRVFNYFGNYIENRTMTGADPLHFNDCCFVENKNKVYFAGNSNGSKIIQVLDLETLVLSNIDISNLIANTPGFITVFGGICEDYHNSGNLLLAFQDNVPGDDLDLTNAKCYIYRYNIENGTVTKIIEFDRDFIYIQGITVINDILYMNLNQITTGSPSNYKGIKLKVLNLNTGALIDNYLISGNFEGEGLDYIINDSTPKLLLGICKYGNFGYVVNTDAPY